MSYSINPVPAVLILIRGYNRQTFYERVYRRSITSVRSAAVRLLNINFPEEYTTLPVRTWQHRQLGKMVGGVNKWLIRTECCMMRFEDDVCYTRVQYKIPLCSGWAEILCYQLTICILNNVFYK